MSWNANKIRVLRRRMGWSQSDLARRLNCKTEQVIEWETSLTTVEDAISAHADALILLERQAEVQCDTVIQAALADVVMEETKSGQVDTVSVKRRFLASS